MISNATNALKSDLELPKTALNSSKEPRKDSAFQEADTAHFSPAAVALAAGEATASGKAVKDRQDGTDGKEAGEAAAAEDPKAKHLADFREWAALVERDLRLQQQKLLEQTLKQSGRHVESGDGKFIVLLVAGPQGEAKTEETADEPQVPEYWNAENTSDRIVHFATQMAEISGLDPETFAKTIKDAVGAGFDQANEATGELPGAAGKLNRDTRDLVFSKLSKWLEDRKSLPYNEEAQSQATVGAENALA